jgi:hypothetical protein
MSSGQEAEALRQRLEALVKGADTAEAKAAAARHRVQAARPLLEEEQAATADLERKAAVTKGLLPPPSNPTPRTTRPSSPTYTSRLRRFRTFANW